ncbi:hypothetical protein B0H19DRAFT_1058704 [Mycena capillaripes]|nr:hypothetical protein B0H19DRAFT_1058704 [Mycena capillaripes]
MSVVKQSQEQSLKMKNPRLRNTQTSTECCGCPQDESVHAKRAVGYYGAGRRMTRIWGQLGPQLEPQLHIKLGHKLGHEIEVLGAPTSANAGLGPERHLFVIRAAPTAELWQKNLLRLFTIGVPVPQLVPQFRKLRSSWGTSWGSSWGQVSIYEPP